MALPQTPIGYSNWNDYIETNAPALAASESIILQEAKASLKLLYVAEPERQAVDTPSYRIYNQFTTWAERTVAPMSGRPWRESSESSSGLTIDTNIDGQLGGWSPNALSVAANPVILSTYSAGSTITWQDGTTATILQIEDYGYYYDIFWDPSKTGTLFPITLTN